MTAERNRQRGTAAHNTVVVDGADSSEVWAGFRVARRAHARLLSARTIADAVEISGSHDGYLRLPGRNVHSRTWRLDAGSLHLDDQVSGSFAKASAHFHFHPDVHVERLDHDALRLSAAGQRIAEMRFQGAVAVTLSQGTWHPRFGITEPNWNAVAGFGFAGLRTSLCWKPTG
jgi:uncharacterized heparinase superfamily protein